MAGLVGLARYRLRFLLQEIDLPQGETVIGRSSACHVTIEDPLISRRHARVVVDADRATIEDLGSRNGLTISGRPVVGVTDVSEGARIRIGTQELVLCRTAEEYRGTSVTGFMIHCGGCGFPIAAEHQQCPHCGSQPRTEDATLSGLSKEGWSLDLVVETVARAVSLGRWQDAERVLRTAQSLVEEMMNLGEPIDRLRLDDLAQCAVAVSLERGQAEWGLWALETYASLGEVPPAGLGRELGELPAAERASLVSAAERILDSVVCKRNSHRSVARSDSSSGSVSDVSDDDLEVVRQLASLPEDDESPRGAGMVG